MPNYTAIVLINDLPEIALLALEQRLLPLRAWPLLLRYPRRVGIGRHVGHSQPWGRAQGRVLQQGAEVGAVGCPGQLGQVRLAGGGRVVAVVVFGPGAAAPAGVHALVAAHGDLRQVLVVLGVVPSSRLVGHQHFGRLVRLIPHRFELDVLGDVPPPVGSVRTQGTLEGFLVQVTDDVDVESGRRGRPEGAVRALEHAFMLRHGDVVTVGGNLIRGG